MSRHPESHPLGPNPMSRPPKQDEIVIFCGVPIWTAADASVAVYIGYCRDSRAQALNGGGFVRPQWWWPLEALPGFAEIVERKAA